MTLKRQKIAALLKETPGQEVLAKGWKFWPRAG